MPNIALLLSGGLHDSYSLELISHFSNKTVLRSKAAKILWKMHLKYFDKPELILPTPDELFEVLKFAFESKNLIGCYQLDVSFL